MNTLLIHSEIMGLGDEPLGKKLMESFFTSLVEAEELPDTIFFYNRGIFLCTIDSPVTPYLKVIAQRGTKLLACGTCINHFNVDTISEVSVGTMKILVDHLCSRPGIVTI